MLISEKEIQEIQTRANEGVATAMDLKHLIHELNLYRTNLHDLYQCATSLQRERRRRQVSEAEHLAVIRFARRMAYLLLRRPR